MKWVNLFKQLPQAMEEDLEKYQWQLHQELQEKMRPEETEMEDLKELEEALHDVNDPGEEDESRDQDTPRKLLQEGQEPESPMAQVTTEMANMARKLDGAHPGRGDVATFP